MEGRALSRPVRTGTPRRAALHMIDEPSGRKHPIHQPPHEQFNTPIILFVTVCAKNKKRIFANEQVHQALRDAWHVADCWLIGRYVIMPTICISFVRRD
jgi:hypothetical protein